MRREKIYFLIFVILIFLGGYQFCWARRIKGYQERQDKIIFVPVVEDVRGFWMADITLFSVIAETLGVDSNREIIKEWIEFQQQEAQETFGIVYLLLDILKQVEERGLTEKFQIADLDGEVVKGIKYYFGKVCQFLNQDSASQLADGLVNKIINNFFFFSLTPESRALIESIYTAVFSSQ
jgi:hypothetical protein